MRVNAILPGLMDTPMAIERRVSERGVSREVIRQERDEDVPLSTKDGAVVGMSQLRLRSSRPTMHGISQECFCPLMVA